MNKKKKNNFLELKYQNILKKCNMIIFKNFNCLKII